MSNDLRKTEATEATEPTMATTPGEPTLWGLLAEYGDGAALAAAAQKVRDAGYQRWDCYTPYPVHGLDRAMGVRSTTLPWLVLGGGFAGCAIAVGLQWYCNSPHTDAAALGGLGGYPLIFSGKPFWSLPANIPIAFELSVLLASLTAFFGLWALTGLPRLSFPAFGCRRFRRATDDGFFLIIETADKNFDPTETRQLLLQTDCTEVEEIRD